MRLVILSRSARIPSTKRLVTVARQRGHDVRVVNPADVALVVSGKGVGARLGQRKWRPPALVIPRVGGIAGSHALSVIEYLCSRGTVALNDAHALGQARNVGRCLLTLAQHGVAVPRAALVRSAALAQSLVEAVGGAPLLIRLVDAAGEVLVAETPQAVESALEAVMGLGHGVLVEEYVRNVADELRVVVIGGRVLGAGRRIGRPKRVGKAIATEAPLELVQPSPETAELAIAAARALGLEFCAVDVLEVSNRRVVSRVASTPHLGPLSEALGVDVAEAIVQHGEVLYAQRVMKNSP
jgi:ribosomal protein S6--L-glutamate ligase